MQQSITLRPEDIQAIEAGWPVLTEEMVHREVAVWVGPEPGDCGFECACGTVYDGFDTVGQALAIHGIADDGGDRDGGRENMPAAIPATSPWTDPQPHPLPEPPHAPRSLDPVRLLSEAEGRLHELQKALAYLTGYYRRRGAVPVEELQSLAELTEVPVCRTCGLGLVLATRGPSRYEWLHLGDPPLAGDGHAAQPVRGGGR